MGTHYKVQIIVILEVEMFVIHWGVGCKGKESGNSPFHMGPCGKNGIKKL
jgi:hypothetical protein